jgi:hypothetical protein
MILTLSQLNTPRKKSYIQSLSELHQQHNASFLLYLQHFGMMFNTANADSKIMFLPIWANKIIKIYAYFLICYWLFCIECIIIVSFFVWRNETRWASIRVEYAITRTTL